jgi:ketosteroid isomerase-like protein
LTNADRVVAELEGLEHDWMQAVRDRDMAFLEALLAEEFTLTTGRPGAEVRGRREWLDITRDRYVIEEFSFEELEVVSLGEAAVVRSRYRQRGRMDDRDRTQEFLITDAFVRRDGKWRAGDPPHQPARACGLSLMER